MKPILYEADETLFETNGIGRLSDAISCIVAEEINGAYELEMDYPVTGLHFADLTEGRIIYATHDETQEPQPFEIYSISRPIGGRVTVKAWHLSYRLNKITVKPYKATGVAQALSRVPENTFTACPFTFWTDKTATAAFNLRVPIAVRSLFGGMEGSFIDIYGGEWEYDHFQCKLWSRRGTNSGQVISYGKNLTDVTKTTDMTNLWTGIVPYWQGQDANDAEVVVYYNGVIESPLASQYSYVMVVPMDASEDIENKPTQAQLKTWGEAYVANNAKGAIPTSIDVSFVQLWQTEEYKNVAPLQRLHLGDSVTIRHEALGVDNTARIVSYQYNTLLERYDSMTVGDVRTTFTQSISSGLQELKRAVEGDSTWKVAINAATNRITGTYGGYIVLDTDADGNPYQLLIMNTPDKTTATRVIRLNYEGIAFGTGYNGPFNSAWTSIDGTFDASNINVVNLDAASITSGTIDASVIAVINLDASKITTGTLSASKISGGTLTIGGASNQRGTISMLDNDGAVAGFINNTGFTVNAGFVRGRLVFYNGTSTAKAQQLGIGDGKFNIGGDYAVNITKNTTIGGTLDVSEKATFGNLSAVGDIDFGGVVTASNEFSLYSGTFQGLLEGSVLDYSEVRDRRPISSFKTDGRRVACLSARVNGSNYEVRVSGQWGTTGTTYSWKTIWSEATSDIRLKENIEPTEVNGLEAVKQMRLRQFDWIRTGAHQDIGFVADELEEIDANLAHGGGYDEDGQMDEKSVNVYQVVAYLTKAVQELTAKVEELEEKLHDSKRR